MKQQDLSDCIIRRRRFNNMFMKYCKSFLKYTFVICVYSTVFNVCIRPPAFYVYSCIAQLCVNILLATGEWDYKKILITSMQNERVKPICVIIITKSDIHNANRFYVLRLPGWKQLARCLRVYLYVALLSVDWHRVPVIDTTREPLIRIVLSS